MKPQRNLKKHPRALSLLPDLLQDARQNTAYRRVLFTGKNTQIVAMSIAPGEEIGEEKHAHVEQLLLDVAGGGGRATVERVRRKLNPGNLLVVRPGSRHNIVNLDRRPLKLLTVYSPPNHLRRRVHQTKQDAEADLKDAAFGEQVGHRRGSALPLLLGLASLGLGGSGKLDSWITLRPFGPSVTPTRTAIASLVALALGAHFSKRTLRPLRDAAASAAAGLALGGFARAIARKAA